jgi:glycine betaine catabolism B
MPSAIKKFLNSITMYRLMLYYLLVLWLASTIFSFTGVLKYNPSEILFTGIYLIIICNFANHVLAGVFKARANLESASITALILTLIVGSLAITEDVVLTTFIGFAAMTSKYLLATRKKHIFNPAAVAVFATAMLFDSGASWWIGSMPTLPIIVAGGLLVLVKIKRLELVASFIAVHFLTQILFGRSVTVHTFLAPATWFFVFVMLVEPLTSPSTKNKQIVFGSFVAMAYFLLPKIIPGYAYGLETALLTGNVLNLALSPTFNLVLTFNEKKKVAKDTWAFYFQPMSKFKFTPGQYMEWTLAHKNPDSRGTRRYFTISSAPKESQITLTIKIAKENGSSFKSAMMNLEKGQELTASSPQGNFVLPKDKNTPLALVAGGIGVTPFRSIIKQMLTKNEKGDIILLYSNRDDEDIAFRKLFEKAKVVGVKTVYINTKKDGYIDETTIEEKVPEYHKRTFYISGPEPMVEAYKKMLSKMKVNKMKTDFFPGYTETHQK